MSTLLQLLTTALVIGSATSCNMASNPTTDVFTPAQGWILVKNGSIADVRAAITEYDNLARDEQPAAFRVQLHPQSNGTVAVLLPDGFPVYDLANMTVWLSAPPDQENVHDAVSWITAPGNGAKYYLEPEVDNPWGDTLIGASTEGLSVRVYVPETGVSKASSRHVSYKEEPAIELSPNPTTIGVVLDTNTAFGNPAFDVNSPDEHSWD